MNRERVQALRAEYANIGPRITQLFHQLLLQMARFDRPWVVFAENSSDGGIVQTDFRGIPSRSGLDLKPISRSMVHEGLGKPSYDSIWGIMANGDLLCYQQVDGPVFRMPIANLSQASQLTVLDSAYLYLKPPKGHTEPVTGPLTLDTKLTIWWSPETEEEAREWQRDAKAKGDVAWYTVDLEHPRSNGQPDMAFHINTTIGRALTHYERPDAVAGYFEEVEDALEQINTLFKQKHGTNV